MSTLVVAARLPGELPLHSKRWTVAAPVCADGDALGYWRALERHWRTDLTLVNVEHDMACTDDLIAELVACPHPLCTHAYRIYYPTTHEHVPKYAQNESLVGWHPPIDSIVRYTARGIEWLVCDRQEWADFSGIGFCKIAPEARVHAGDGIAPLAENEWPWLEMSVNAGVRGRWHVHWPGVEHHHR